MSGVEVVYDTIKTFLQTPANVAVLADPVTSVVPTFRFENDSGFVPPVDTLGNPAPWIGVAFSSVVYGQQSIGMPVQAQNRWDESGTLWLSVFVPSGTGASRARQIAKMLADLFRGLTTLLNGFLEFLNAYIGHGAAAQEDGNWFEIPVGIDWSLMDA